MLQTLTDDGYMTYECPNGCGALVAHISHEQVAAMNEQVIALPPCSHCGARMGLNTRFSERELAPPVVTTAIIDSRVPKEGIVRVEYPEGASVNLNTVRYHLEKFTVPDGVGGREDIIFPAFDGIMQHPAVALHRRLAEQMAAIGKVPPSPSPAAKTTPGGAP